MIWLTPDLRIKKSLLKCNWTIRKRLPRCKMRLKKRLLAFSRRLHARIRKTRYMHKMRCLLINRRSLLLALRFFFFQAEDGIRDLIVTGVQTCALPISMSCSGNRPASMAANTRLPSSAVRAARNASRAASAASAASAGSAISANASLRGSGEHTSELQSRSELVCRLLLEKKKKETRIYRPPETHGLQPKPLATTGSVPVPDMTNQHDSTMATSRRQAMTMTLKSRIGARSV